MAAEAVVSVVLEKLGELLAKQVGEEIDLLTGVEEKVRQLADTFRSLQALLSDAQRRTITDENVKVWVQDLERVCYEVDDVLDEWNYNILKREVEQKRVCPSLPFSCFCFKQLVMNRDISLKINEISEKLELIDQRRNRFSFVTSSAVASSSQQRVDRKTTSLIDESQVFGRDDEKESLNNQLLSKGGGGQQENASVQVVSLIGPGGVGKTTLAQMAYNNDLKGHFEKRIWVCVSKPFDKTKIAKAILESLGSSSATSNHLNTLHEHIRDSLTHKRILLVLDDVWTHDRSDWEFIKFPLQNCATESKILLSTRNEEVAKSAGATFIRVGILSPSHSWSLFSKIAFDGRLEKECNRLEDIGKEAMEKCKGLPLAIKSLAGLLYRKNTFED